jgi:hypothetical protein
VPGSVVPTPTKVWDGDVVLTTPGDVVADLDVHGRIVVKAAGCRGDNVVVRGLDTGIGFNTGLVDCTHANVSGFTLTNALLVPTLPSVWWNGVLGHDYTARQVEIAGTVDGFGIYNTHGPEANVDIEDTFVHDLAFFASDPNHRGGGTHNDCCQVQSGLNIRIVNNVWHGFLSTAAGDQSPMRQSSSVIQVTQGVGPVGNVLIEGNDFDGGVVATINLSSKPLLSMSFGRVANNRFGRNSHMGNPVIMAPTTVCETVGNVYDDNGTPVLIRRNGA